RATWCCAWAARRWPTPPRRSASWRRCRRAAPRSCASSATGRKRSSPSPRSSPLFMLEREVKIKFADPDRARAALAKIGAVPLRPRRLQDDTLFDTADGVLRAKRAVVRLRREPDRAYVTFKGPVQPGTMKIREEQETEVGDAEVLRRV